MEAALGEQQSLPEASFRNGDQPDDDLMVSRLVSRHDIACKPGQSVIDARNAAFFAPRRPFKPVALAFREVVGRFFLPGRKHADAEARPETETHEQT